MPEEYDNSAAVVSEAGDSDRLSVSAQRKNMSAVSVILFLIVPAIFFAFWGLRHAGGAPLFHDSPRHALNGALILDMIREGGYMDPVAYTRQYYNRLPSLSVPYHPPVFPAIEAAFYAVFGVSNFSARLAVAVCVAVSFVLLYALIAQTHARAVAFFASVAFFSLATSQWMAGEVMLEFPSLVFVLAALIVLQRNPRLDFRSAMLFAALSSAAVWTKQTSLFVAAVPFALVVIRRQWRELRNVWLWVSALLIGSAMAALMALTALAQVGGNRTWHVEPLHLYLWRRIVVYAEATVTEITLIGVALAVAGVGWYAWSRVRGGRMRETDLYAAWLVAGFGFIVLLPPYTQRYLFYIYPALAVVVFATLADAARRFRVAGVAWYVGAAIAVAALFAVSMRSPNRLDEFTNAAQTVLSWHPGRVLICAEHNGAFTFSVRVLEPDRKTAVIRGEALPAEWFQPARFEQFLHEYGIGAVVIEDVPAAEAYDAVLKQQPASLVFEQRLPIAAYPGEVYVYRFLNPSPSPKQSITLPSAIVRGGIQVDLP